MQLTRDQRAMAAHWNFSQNCSESLVFEKRKVVLLNPYTLRLVYIHWVEYPLETWHFQTLVFEVCEMSIVLWSYELAMCWYSPIHKRRIFMPNQSSPLQRTLLECLSSKGNLCHTLGIWMEEAGYGCLFQNDRRNLCGKEASVAFLSKEALGMESLYWSEYTNQPGCFHSLDFWRFCDDLCPVCMN